MPAPRGSSTSAVASARWLVPSACAWCAPSERPTEQCSSGAEADGKTHSPWVLDATVIATDEGSRLVMHLHYGGSLWGPVLERMLGDEIEESRPRLLAVPRRELIRAGQPGGRGHSSGRRACRG